jgi:hypothetical protein
MTRMQRNSRAGQCSPLVGCGTALPYVRPGGFFGSCSSYILVCSQSKSLAQLHHRFLAASSHNLTTSFRNARSLIHPHHCSDFIVILLLCFSFPLLPHTFQSLTFIAPIASCRVIPVFVLSYDIFALIPATQIFLLQK